MKLFAHVTDKSQSEVGPGSYDIGSSIGHGSKKYSIGQRIPIKEEKATGEFIGPISTLINQKRTISPVYRQHTLENTPGPQYIPKPFGCDSPKFTFHSRTPIPESIGDCSVGPGAYNTRKEPIDNTRLLFLKGRSEEGKSENTPSPAEYSPNVDAYKKSPRKCHIHSRIPETKVRSVSPSPADYSIPSSITIKPKVLMSPRKFIDIRSDSPGPAAYDINDRFGEIPPIKIGNRMLKNKIEPGGEFVNVPSFVGLVPPIKLKGNHRRAKPSDTPGPSYNGPGFGSQSTKIAIHPRILLKDPSLNSSDTPLYNTTKEIISNTPIIKMRSRVRDFSLDESENPGPGHYNPKPENLPMLTIGKRIPNTKKQDESMGYFVFPQELPTPIKIGTKARGELIPV